MKGEENHEGATIQYKESYTIVIDKSGMKSPMGLMEINYQLDE